MAQRSSTARISTFNSPFRSARPRSSLSLVRPREEGSGSTQARALARHSGHDERDDLDDLDDEPAPEVRLAAAETIAEALEARRAALERLDAIASAASMDPRARARLQFSPQCDVLDGRPPKAICELLRPLTLVNHAGMSLRAPSFAASCLIEGRLHEPREVEWTAACLRAPLSYYRVLTGKDAVVRLEDVLRDGLVIELSQDPGPARPAPWSVICARVVEFRGVFVFDACASIAVPSRSIGELRAYARAIARSTTPMDVATLCRHDLALLANFASAVHGEARYHQRRWRKS